MAGIFSKIINREIPAYIVAEDDQCLAFLDINPIALGHVLVVPKVEIDNLFDLPLEVYNHLWTFARNIANNLKANLECKKIGIAVIGLEVPHAHIHLVPINHVGDINFSKPKLNPTKDELDRILNLISSKTSI
jgi:histidine triad (HIT) family protein